MSSRMFAPAESIVITVVVSVFLYLGWDRFGNNFLAVAMFLGSLLGFILTAWAARDTYYELLTVRTLLNGTAPVLTLIAQANLRREIFRMVTFASLTGLSFVVIYSIRAPALGRVLLLAAIASLIANSIHDRIERERSARILRAQLITHEIEPELIAK